MLPLHTLLKHGSSEGHWLPDGCSFPSTQQPLKERSIKLSFTRIPDSQINSKNQKELQLFEGLYLLAFPLLTAVSFNDIPVAGVMRGWVKFRADDIPHHDSRGGADLHYARAGLPLVMQLMDGSVNVYAAAEKKS